MGDKHLEKTDRAERRRVLLRHVPDLASRRPSIYRTPAASDPVQARGKPISAGRAAVFTAVSTIATEVGVRGMGGNQNHPARNSCDDLGRFTQQTVRRGHPQ
ncbi:hypothetical protein TVNIR_3527 [Thioalkalivibrio nitratireducens DSM 14787]|uniref:Uncharacterized protein n=1 Tax=Thioalkalivibrio nitratireducens (strain DSM 14787 / UNIQEM 213 / ALEN2) TaxID=1255043 RepID=L0E1S5_THIND|nr:hypothetical protein TVNIR_3527 [Thioalkalivibrio nitratireducens DSM 14787]